MASQPAYAPLDEPAGGGAMSDDELAGFLAEHEQRAIGYYESEIASEQADALDRYYRRPYGDEREGRSKVVDATVAITVDNALAAVLKPFVSSDETVVFEPRSQEDEEQAQQATEYCNYVLHQDNCGFLILHDWMKDALLQKVGVVKAYWEDTTREKVERIDRLTPLEIEALQEEGALGEVYGPDDFGLYTADVLRSDPDGRLCIENIPPEEYRISPFARPGRTPPYEAHCTAKPRSELIDLGFDPKVVESLSKSAHVHSDAREIARREDESYESMGGIQPPGDPSRELVDFNDEYALIDYDGDGVSELRHVIRSGNVILFNEEVDRGPFARLCPAPMPHKIYGLSVADQVKDEQRISTVLWRQTLDNLYLSNNPRPVVGSGAERDDGSTIDDILSDAPGAVIRAKDATQLTDFSVPFVADKSYPMLEYVNQQAESRTGISQSGQGMDPEALDKAKQITATQAAIMQDGRNSRAELIARIFAETGIKDLFKMMLRLLVQHQPKARMIRLRNKWVEMDPRSWNAEMDVSIAVGMGLGNKAEQIATAQTIIDTMGAIAQSPFPNLIDEEKAYNAAKRLFNAAGIKNVDDFLNEPERDENGEIIPTEQPPSPEQQKVEAEIEAKGVELQMKQAEGEANLAMKREEMDAKLALEREKLQAEAIMNQQRMAQELVLERERMAMEHEVNLVRARMDDERAARDADRRDRETDSKIKKNRSGGDLSK